MLHRIAVSVAFLAVGRVNGAPLSSLDQVSPPPSFATPSLPPPNQSLDIQLPVDLAAAYGSPCTISLVDNHTFTFSYGKPFVGTYTPPPECLVNQEYSLAYLRLSASVDRGRQFDRIAAVWVDGVELLRTTTQEPNRAVGPEWHVFKDISHYRSIFQPSGGHVTVVLDNVVDATYTSSFHVSVVVELYKANASYQGVRTVPAPPDVIVPISRHGTDGYPWFTVEPQTAGRNHRTVTLPRHVDGLFVEVFLSHHGCDEFHYANPTDDYKTMVGSTCGGGAFREVQVLVDDEIVGAVWPFPLIYTGGMSPALWRPMVAIGAFEVPTYIVDLTPFLARVVDGQPHKFGFAVDHGLDYWPVTGNLLVYLDASGEPTAATIESLEFAPHVVPTVVVNGQGPDDLALHTTAYRHLAVHATITTKTKGTRQYNLSQSFQFVNHQLYWANATNQHFRQATAVHTSTSVERIGGLTSADSRGPTVVTASETYVLSGTSTYDEYYEVALPDMLQLAAAAAAHAPLRHPRLTSRLGHLNGPSFERSPRFERPPGHGGGQDDDDDEVWVYVFYNLNTTIGHSFDRSRQVVRGDARDISTGLHSHSLRISQNATSLEDSKEGITTAVTAAELTATNATGCFARVVRAIDGEYTDDTEDSECDAPVEATPRPPQPAKLTMHETTKTWSIWDSTVVRLVLSSLWVDIVP